MLNGHLASATMVVVVAGLLVSALIAVVVAVSAWTERRYTIWRLLTLAALAVALWCFGHGMALSTDGGALRRFWFTVSLLGWMVAVPLLFSFALYFTHLERLMSRRGYALLWGPFLLAMALALTNRWHGLIWPTAADSALTPDGLAGHGVYFQWMVGLTYVLLIAANVIILRNFWGLRHLYRMQAAALAIAITLPLTVNLFVVAYWPPWTTSGPGLLAVAASGLVILYSIARWHLLDLRANYRDILFEQMTESAIVIDTDDRILDMNPTAERALALDDAAIGSPIQSALLQLGPAAAEIDLAAGARHLLALRIASLRYVDLRVMPVDLGGERPPGRLVTWSDVTRLREAMMTIYEQERLIAEQARADTDAVRTAHQQLHEVYAQVQAALAYLDQGEPDTAAVTLAAVNAPSARPTPSAPAGDYFAAVTAYVLHFADVNAVQSRVSIDPELTAAHLAPMERLQAARILQEALENVRKHAHAHHVEVRFERAADGILLVVQDDGIGFDPTQVTGAGIESIHGRAQAVSAHMTLTARPGEGTRLGIHFPTPTQADQPARFAGVRVLLAHSHAIVVKSIGDLLVGAGLEIVATARTAAELLAATAPAPPDLILLDIGLLDAVPLRDVRRAFPKARIMLLLSSDQYPALPALLGEGADGYLPPALTADELLVRLDQVMHADLPLASALANQLLLQFKRREPEDAALAALTPRQREILRLVALGVTYKKIGAQLFVSERTVRYHMEHIRQRLGLTSRNQVRAYARTHGLID